MSVVIGNLELDGRPIGQMVAAEKKFKTGSVGFYGSGKVVIGDKRYQTSLMLVEIGSKPEAPGKKK
jgi:hypothetical protein